MFAFSFQLFFSAENTPLLTHKDSSVQMQAKPSAPAAAVPTRPKPILKGQSFTSSPDHWQAIDIDGELLVDSAGGLVVNRALRRLFDHFLSTVGDVELEQIKRQLKRYIEATAPPVAALQAQQLLQTYLDYKNRLQELSEQQQYAGQQSEQIKRRIELKQNLRKHFFEHDVLLAFFSVEENAESRLLQQWAIQQDETLNQQEQLDALAAIQAPLSKEQKLMQRLRDRLANPQLQQFDPATQRRLSQLDEQRLQWQQRMQQYRLQQSAIASDDEQALLALRQQFFSPLEIKRVAALDLVMQQQTAATNFVPSVQKTDPQGFNRRLGLYQTEKQQLQISQGPDADATTLQALINSHFSEPKEVDLVQTLEGLNQ